MVIGRKKYDEMMTEIRDSFALQEKQISELKKDYEQKVKGKDKKFETQLKKLEEKHKKDIAEMQKEIKELTSRIGKSNSVRGFNEIMDEYLNGEKGKKK